MIKAMLSKNLIKAQSHLQGDLQIVLVKDDDVIKIFDKGISPWIEMVDMAWDLKDFSVATRHLSKASAYMCKLLGVKEVYAEKMSEEALSILEKFVIENNFVAIEEDSILDTLPDDIEPEDVYRKLRKELDF